MKNKVSIITVVFNDAANIRETIESALGQTYQEKEYIIIDGGSTDGTVEIINEYVDRIDYFSSESDNGIFDAMNKGAQHATGEWINFLNSGDTFASPRALEEVIELGKADEADVIYADRIVWPYRLPTTHRSWPFIQYIATVHRSSELACNSNILSTRRSQKPSDSHSTIT